MEIKEVNNSNKWGVDFANLINSNRPKEKIGAVVGDVVGVDPLVVQILNGDVIINSDEHTVYISSHLLDTYTREMKGSGNIRFGDEMCGITTPNGACQTAGNHEHEVKSLYIDTKYEFDGEIAHTDGFKVGDMVLVQPDETEQIFFIISKLVKVGGG